MSGRIAPRKLALMLLACALSMFTASAWAQLPWQQHVRHLESRLDAQAEEIRRLREQLETRTPLLRTLPDGKGGSCTPDSLRRLPLVMEEPVESDKCEDATDDPLFHRLEFTADYDKGFVVRAFHPQRNPFLLRANAWIQFRHHGFARNAEFWTDNAGITRAIRNRNALDIERGRVTLAGYAVDRRLTYFLQLDGDTDGAHTVDFFDYWWAWQWTESLQIQVGKRKVPASRQWLLGARRTRLIDRPMTNDFFRPDRTVGVFGVGRIGDRGHYEWMVGNGYSSSNVPNVLGDDRLTFAMTNYVDPYGDYGGQLVDFNMSSEVLARWGHSFVYSPQAGFTEGIPLAEADFVRLADGTRLTQPGALAPGITVSDFDIFFYGADAGFKWRGWSMNAELFLRWIEGIVADGALPTTSIFQSGYYVEGGRFLVPQKFDLNARFSQVHGEFGDALEYAAGLNWYPLAKPSLKISFDVTLLDGSPLQNTTSDILVGDNGALFRTQFQAEF